jgi:ATP-dependent Zn protease
MPSYDLLIRLRRFLRRKPIPITPLDEFISVHEAGHALIAWRSPALLRFRRVDAFGAMTFGDFRTGTADGVFEAMVFCMGGPAAEIVCYGDFNFRGAIVDISTAFFLGDRLLAKWSLPEHIRQRSHGGGPLCRRMNPRLPKQVVRLMDVALAEAAQRLLDHSAELAAIYGFLLKHGQADGMDLFKLIGPEGPKTEKDPA